MAANAGRLNAPPLEGWITLTEAATLLHLSRWAVHKICRGPDAELKSVRFVGDPVRPFYIVREAEVLTVKREREAAEAAAAKAAALAPESEGPQLLAVNA